MLETPGEKREGAGEKEVKLAQRLRKRGIAARANPSRRKAGARAR